MIQIPISIGELLDKISILMIKSQHSTNFYIHKELEDLTKIAKENQIFDEFYINQLFEINQKLWNIEDALRNLEKEKDFGHTFIELARSVYITNDKRAEIKKEINEKNNSDYMEIKIY